MFAHSARAVLHEIGLLLFPRGCAGCGKPDEVVCPSCQHALSQMLQVQVNPSICTSGRVFACAAYQSVVRHMILSWKDGQDLQCDRVFAASLQELIASPKVQLALQQVSHDQQLLIVPVPSSWKSRRMRGRWQTVVLARAVASKLRALGWQAQYKPLLGMRGKAAKSLTLSSGNARATRLNGRLRLTHQGRVLAEHAHSSPKSYQVILIDDIITTGSTIRACCATLQHEGLPVVTACALAMVHYEA